MVIPGKTGKLSVFGHAVYLSKCATKL
jgi:hypothetical protein